MHYGFDEKNYAAQQMLTTYRKGQSYGSADVFSAAITGLTSVGVGIFSTVVQTQEANKQREHELSVLDQQEKMYQQQLAISQSQTEASGLMEFAKTERFKTMIFAGVGVVAFLGLSGIGIAFLRRGED